MWASQVLYSGIAVSTRLVITERYRGCVGRFCVSWACRVHTCKCTVVDTLLDDSTITKGSSYLNGHMINSVYQLKNPELRSEGL